MLGRRGKSPVSRQEKQRESCALEEYIQVVFHVLREQAPQVVDRRTATLLVTKILVLLVERERWGS
jgi:hypothetical protein